jgi:glutamyl-tRNA reductase
MSERSKEAMQAESIVQAKVERFAKGQQTLTAVPAIVSLQQSMEELRQAELRRMQSKLQSLSEEQRGAVEALTRGLINKVLHQPLQAMKTAARNGDLTVVEAVQQIFGLSSQGDGLSSQVGAAAQQNDVGEAKEAKAQTVTETAERDAFEATRR